MGGRAILSQASGSLIGPRAALVFAEWGAGLVVTWRLRTTERRGGRAIRQLG